MPKRDLTPEEEQEYVRLRQRTYNATWYQKNKDKTLRAEYHCKVCDRTIQRATLPKHLQSRIHLLSEELRHANRVKRKILRALK